MAGESEGTFAKIGAIAAVLSLVFSGPLIRSCKSYFDDDYGVISTPPQQKSGESRRGYNNNPIPPQNADLPKENSKPQASGSVKIHKNKQDVQPERPREVQHDEVARSYSADTTPETEQSTDENFYTFELKGCTLDGSSLYCQLLVINRGEDRDLSLQSYTSRIIDDEGNAYQSKSGAAKLGACSSANPHDTVVSRVPTKAGIVFDEVPRSLRSIRLLELVFLSQGTIGEVKVRFQDVRVHQEGKH